VEPPKKKPTKETSETYKKKIEKENLGKFIANEKLVQH
jgi:hypothetical protein